ncbi:MAG: hypothetical protein LBI33_01420 [Propionibacteriaceae bacterium]|jgi:hypothetical protein|nr:hypothetical protein [Propionibacteriaceae bacterium]
MYRSFTRPLALAAAAALAVGSLTVSSVAQAAEVNVIPDAGLRECIAQAMHDAGTGASPGHPDYAAEADSISQADLDTLAAATRYTYGIYCNGMSVKSLEGLQLLNDPELRWLELGNNQISDLTPLAGMTALWDLSLDNNQVINLVPLAGLTGLNDLSLSGNQVSNLTPLAGLTNLQWLGLANNKVADVTPLAGLTKLGRVDLSNNQIVSVAPLGTLAAADADLWGLYLGGNKIVDVTPLATWINYNASADWTLVGNQITDVSSLNWAKVSAHWASTPSEYSTGVPLFAVTNQSVVTSAVAGTTVVLPTVKTAAGDPNKVTWSVSGDATVNQAAGTVTYNAAGPVVLSWADQFATVCRYDSSLCSPGQDTTIPVSFFSGRVNVNVTSTPGAGAVPSVPASSAAKPDAPAVATTGRAARLADGTDAYTLVATVKSADGQPLTGYAGELTAVLSSSDLTVVGTGNGFTDRNDGTYALAVAASQPGNYTVTIMLDGTPIATDIPVNFIAADIAKSSVVVGASQTSDGLGFLPGEQVVAWLHSTPANLGTLTADATGKVTVSFTAPSTTGRHTVEFIGETSGTVYVAFDVVAAPVIHTGGTTLPQTNTTMALVLMCGLVASAGFTLAMARQARRVR